MAMLAEPRRKQRIGLNPRGKFFLEDEDNRGRQMLMKLGWKTGDGLGATNQGMSEPLKPKVHTDSRGLGFDRKKDPWVAHNEEFEQLLKNLNSDSNDSANKADGEETSTPTNEALEKKSKGSRSRIHYQKFVKNKDLSRASTKDLSCIFGKALDETASVYSSLNAEIEKEEETEEAPHFLGPTIGEFQITVPGEAEPEEKRKKKKKKRSKEEPEAENVEVEPVEQEQVTPEVDKSQEEDEEVPKKKKKKKSKSSKGNTEELVSNENNEEPVEKVIAEEIEPEEEVQTKKKKKKRKHKSLEDKIEAEGNLVEEELIVAPEDPPEESVEDGSHSNKKKKSKKRRHDSDEAVEVDTQGNEQSAECEYSEPVSKKKKKRRKEPEADLVSQNNSTEEKSEPVPENVYKPNETDKIEKIGCLQFINRGSLTDYFASKMKSRGLSSTFQM